MNATDLKSLLYTYLAVLRAPGGAEHIGFAIEQHIAWLSLVEALNFGPVSLRDLPQYRTGPARGEHRETGDSPEPADVSLSDRVFSSIYED